MDKTVRPYTTRRCKRPNEPFETVVIIERETKREIAEYRLRSTKSARYEIACWRETINKHLDEGGTLGNFQW